MVGAMNFVLQNPCTLTAATEAQSKSGNLGVEVDSIIPAAAGKVGVEYCQISANEFDWFHGRSLASGKLMGSQIGFIRVYPALRLTG